MELDRDFAATWFQAVGVGEGAMMVCGIYCVKHNNAGPAGGIYGQELYWRGDACSAIARRR